MHHIDENLNPYFYVTLLTAYGHKVRQQEFPNDLICGILDDLYTESMFGSWLEWEWEMKLVWTKMAKGMKNHSKLFGASN